MYSMYLVRTVITDQTVLLNMSSTISLPCPQLIHNYTSIVMEQGLIILIYIDRHIRHGHFYPSVKGKYEQNSMYVLLANIRTASL